MKQNIKNFFIIFLLHLTFDDYYNLTKKNYIIIKIAYFLLILLHFLFLIFLQKLVIGFQKIISIFLLTTISITLLPLFKLLNLQPNFYLSIIASIKRLSTFLKYYIKNPKIKHAQLFQYLKFLLVLIYLKQIYYLKKPLKQLP